MQLSGGLAAKCSTCCSTGWSRNSARTICILQMQIVMGQFVEAVQTHYLVTERVLGERHLPKQIKDCRRGGHACRRPPGGCCGWDKGACMEDGVDK
jgi:predicted transposase YbfD/YdcC